MRKMMIALAVAALLATPAVAGWDIRAAVNAGYVAQVTEPEAGDKDLEWRPTILTGIEWWGKSWGWSSGIAGLVDDKQQTPRVAPYLALHLGKPDMQFFIGSTYDPQGGGENHIAAMFGFTKAFDLP